MSAGSSAHWDGRYDAIGAASVSWYQQTPTLSLELLSALDIGPAHSIVDVGGGASTLVDHLVRRGHRDVAVLDVSSVALGVARDRVGTDVGVSWLVEDVLQWSPPRRWDVWHDRAVLHFLLEESDRERYVDSVRRAVGVGGAIVIGVFAEDGPTECSALPVHRYSAGDLRNLFGPMDVVAERRELHRTPTNATQPFNWLAARLA